jgi:hypothetical protein
LRKSLRPVAEEVGVDPDEALAQAREAARLIEQHADQHPVPVTAGMAEAGRKLSEAFVALDGWIVGGGFLPAAWRRDEHG